MQFTSLTARFSMLVHPGGQAHSEQTEDLAYQAMTVVAILLVLASIWIF